MDETATGSAHLVTLLFAPEFGLWGMIALTLLSAVGAMVLASLPALPVAYWLSGDPRTRHRPLRRLLLLLVQAMLALPSILIGLLIYLAVSTTGPLGSVGLAFSPWALVLAQSLLVFPLLVALFAQTFAALPARYAELALATGASERQIFEALVRQVAPSLAAAATVGFARLLGEGGAALIAGGNLVGLTRTLSTASYQQLQRGEFGLALALGMILFAAGLAVSLAVNLLGRWGRAA